MTSNEAESESCDFTEAKKCNSISNQIFSCLHSTSEVARLFFVCVPNFNQKIFVKLKRLLDIKNDLL